METMLAAVPFAALVMLLGIPVLIVVLGARATRRTRENLSRLALDLGLQLHERPPVLGLFRAMPTVDGERGGRKVRFFQFSTGSGKNRTVWSAVGVSCANPHGLQLRLGAQSFLTVLGEKFGLQDLRLGVQPFDDKFVVQTNAPDFLRAALLPEIREQLLRYWPFKLGSSTLKIEGGEVVYAERGSFSDEKLIGRMKSLLDSLLALAALPEVYSA